MTENESDESVLERLTRVHQSALDEIRAAQTIAELDSIRRSAVGRTGELLQIRRSIGSLSPEDRRIVGAALGPAQQEVTEALHVREQELLDAEPALAAPFDVTVPAPVVGAGGCIRRCS